MMIWLAIALGYSGFAALWRTMAHPAHLPAGWPMLPASRHRWLRVLGWTLLALSFVLCARLEGAAIGAVLWLGTLTASAVLLVLGLLPYRPRAIMPLAFAAPLVTAMLGWLIA